MAFNGYLLAIEYCYRAKMYDFVDASVGKRCAIDNDICLFVVRLYGHAWMYVSKWCVRFLLSASISILF